MKTYINPNTVRIMISQKKYDYFLQMSNSLIDSRLIDR